MKLYHVIESQQFTVPMLMELFALAGQMEKILARGGSDFCKSKIMASLFYETSTRTRLSFESAMLRLGGTIMSTENARAFSSVAIGETLEDTVRVLNSYADVIVVRHNEIGGAKRAAAVSSVPIINAGDGKGGQHPTQALLDLYTIYKERGAIEGLKIAIVGDLANGRTARSLSYLLGKFDRVMIFFIAPDVLQMRSDLLDYLSAHNVWFTLEPDMSKVLPEVDVLYQTRIERERLGDRADEYEAIARSYFLDRTLIQAMREDAIIMHPLPRLNEISPEVDADPRAAYFRQVRNGVVVRMALLETVLFD